MLKTLNELFVKTLKLSPELWLYILIAVVGVAFLVTLLIGLLAGEFKKIKSLMKSAIANPKAAVAAMQKMPVGIKKQYKRARVGGIEPSMLVTEDMCVETPYKRSLISKLWIVTFVATLVCAAIAGVVTPLACQTLNAADAAEAFNVNAVWLLPVTVLVVGGLLTFIGAVISHSSHVGAAKTYAKFVVAIDGGDVGAVAAEQNIPRQPEAPVFTGEPVQQPVAFEAHEPQQAEPINNNEYFADDFGTNDTVAEPVYAAEPVAEPVVTVAQEESDEDIRRRAREEALMRARAEQQAQAQAAAEAQARAQAEAQARAAAEAQARAAAQAQAAQAQPQGSSSADDIIARIEKIDREGAPRETMREVATLLQKERAKPENKTPEQQKKLNEALSKLLKAMTAASRK